MAQMRMLSLDIVRKLSHRIMNHSGRCQCFSSSFQFESAMKDIAIGQLDDSTESPKNSQILMSANDTVNCDPEHPPVEAKSSSSQNRMKPHLKRSVKNSQHVSDAVEMQLSLDSEFPSEVADMQRKSSELAGRRSQMRHAFRPKIDPLETSIVLFPGQGSQFVGMGKQLLDYPNVIELYDTAKRILGYDLLEVCLRGPREKLNTTVVSQPAVLVTSLAAVERLKIDHSWAVESCVSVAGCDIGEISALVFAGAISFTDAVRLVKVRAEALQSASNVVPSGAIMVFFKPDGKIKFACHAAKLYCTKQLGMNDVVCEITNYLYPGCKVISGNREALEFLEKNAKEFGISRIVHQPLPGAFHTRLMHSALAPVSRILTSLQINEMAVPVHSNLTAKRHRSSAGSISRMITEQMCNPVRWEQTMHILYSRPIGKKFPSSFEVGPGRQLGSLLKQVNAKAFEQYTSIDV